MAREEVKKMPAFLLQKFFAPGTKASSDDFKDAKSSVQRTAASKDAKASLKLSGKDGDVVLTVDDDDLAEIFLADIKELPDVTVSGISSPFSAYVQRRKKKGPSGK